MSDEFEAKVAAIEGGIPIALLPVRIEARFLDGASTLAVRIFPDQIHIDAHERALTAAEREAGMNYWRARAAGDNDAWHRLSRPLDAARAAWVAETLEPITVAGTGDPEFPAVEERLADWSRPAVATALPERWVVVGVRDSTEIFRVWSNPVADDLDVTLNPSDDATQLAGDELALQSSARWLVDFEEAERVGMAVRVTGVPLVQGLDRLYVLGVDWTLGPEAASAAIRELLATHVYTDGLSALVPGTATNVTAAGRPEPPPAGDPLAEALDPQRRPAPQTFAGAGVDGTWRALGLSLDDGDVLTALPGADAREHEVASHMANALWESTLGLYLTDFLNPIFSDAAAAEVRAHVVAHLFAGGPFPALRIGRQPYGILPVIAPRAFTPADGFEGHLNDLLAKLRPHWESAVPRVPHLGRSGDLDADLTNVLQTTPAAATLRYRNVLGPLVLNATRGLEPHALTQERIGELLGAQLGWPARPFIGSTTANPTDHPLRVPLVDPTQADPGAPLAKNYLSEIAVLARTSGTYEAIKAREDADTLLEALVAHAVARELHRADVMVIDDHLLGLGHITERPTISVDLTDELIGVEPVEASTSADVAVITTPFEAARLVLGSRSVRAIVTDAIRAGGTGDPRFGELASAIASLEWLSKRPVAELGRGLRGLLDSYAYRLDAWLTSLATRRLAGVRTSAPTGVHLGAYGWLDDLRPDLGSPTSQGFVHAPSLAQAATAAVLRSGRLAHRDSEHEALDLDLRSDRVRLALGLLDAISSGQPLAALLGYRFERALRDRSLALAQYILPLRRLAPLRTGAGEQPGQPGPSEAIAARDVVDGVTLLERWRTQGAGLLTGLSPVPPEDDRQALIEELIRLADLYDAVADVMLAETVHQHVIGNNERAGAVLAAIDRQGTPPRMEFVRTPRSGTSFTHRVVVLIGDDRVATAWTRDARAAAEPRLNAWIARALGDPERVRFTATVTGGAQEFTASLDQLGLSPMSLVMASQTTGATAPSELEERLIQIFAEAVPTAGADVEIVLVDAPPHGSAPPIVGLGALRALLRRIYDLVTEARPATAADLALPQDAGDKGLDDVELRERADALAQAYGAAVQALEQATTAPELRAALSTAADFGVKGSVSPPTRPGAPDDLARLAERATEVAATMRAAASGAATIAAGASVQERVAAATARMRAMLGAQFPVLPLFTAANAEAFTAARAVQASLLDEDPLAPSAWLGRMALVRAGVDRLARVRTAAELLDGAVEPTDLVVAQLPRDDGERWLALPFAGGVAPSGKLAIVADTSVVFDFSAPLAGMFCDGWPETVPDREETTGIAFHHDAPGARPPQALLIAVPPAAQNSSWSVDAILDTVVEAHDLARVRAVGPRELDWIGRLLPALYLPESLSKDAPAVDLGGLAAKYEAVNAATASILGKG
jgi:hypothetical protein